MMGLYWYCEANSNTRSLPTWTNPWSKFTETKTMNRQKGMARIAERWQNHTEWLIPIAALGCPVLCAGLDCGVSHSWGKSKDSPAAAPDKAYSWQRDARIKVIENVFQVMTNFKNNPAFIAQQVQLKTKTTGSCMMIMRSRKRKTRTQVQT